MMICFDFLNRPIALQTGKISVLVIENKSCFRKTVRALLSGAAEEENIVLSEKNKPIKFRSAARLIGNYFALDYSAHQLKSIYADMAYFCGEEMRQETLELSGKISEYLEKLNENFDFDFTYTSELNLQDLFKIKDLKPDQVCKSSLEALLDYMLLLQKYSHIKCFILLNLHVFFSQKELSALYTELLQRSIPVLVLEGNTCFEPCQQEKYTILDEDLCEIVAEPD